MQFKYSVFSATMTEMPVEVTLPSGRTVTAAEPALFVQLVPLDSDTHGTVSLTINDEITGAALFVPGSTVVATFNAE